MSPPPEPSVAGGDQLDRAIVRLGFAVVLGSIMSVLDTTIVNVALNTLSTDLHASLDSIQWVVTAYLLALAAVIPISGWATRRFGTKRLYIAAIVLFTLGSALCGLAWSTSSLVAFRVIQGIGGGLILPVGQTVLARAAGPRRIGRAMSMVGIPTVLAPIIGPTVGGLLLEHLSWHWIFYVNIPIGIVAVAISLRFLPSDRPGPAGRLDVIGLALLAVGLPAAIYGLAEIQSGHTARWVASLLCGLALIAVFAWHARRTAEPLLDTRLYQKPTFVAASVATFCLGAAIFGGMILLPLYFQNVRGTDPVVTGLLLIPQGVGVAMAMGITGRLVDRVGGGVVALGGVIITSLFTLPLVFIGAHTSYVWISVVLVVRGAGVGASMMPSMAAAFAVLRPDEIHDASPQLNVIQRVGGSVGTAILAVILSHNILDASTGGGGPGPATLARAFGNTFWWALGITAAAAVPAAFLMVAERRTRHRGGGDRDGHRRRVVTDEDGIPVTLFGLGEG